MSGGRHVETAQPGGIGEDFPARAWPDMVALYGGAGIRELCLELQDVFDADIPLLLFLALADRAGMSADALHLEALIRSAAVWRVAAVRPLASTSHDLAGILQGSGRKRLPREDQAQWSWRRRGSRSTGWRGPSCHRQMLADP